ncbi:hypothetical protein [Metabacillus fastidiosus]|uniref:hypothetical protein n=1 Tax=Metabacillus fastidiosus TaxID=1458 RepID=UPI002E1A4A68|nr:hypothetical protein [Metabacillus fastidiosus]
MDRGYTMPELNRNKLYIAHLFKSIDEGYPDIERIEYFVKLGKTYCEFYTDRELQKYRGHLPISWFTDFEEVGSLPAFEYGEMEQLSLFEEEFSDAG